MTFISLLSLFLAPLLLLLAIFLHFLKSCPLAFFEGAVCARAHHQFWFLSGHYHHHRRTQTAARSFANGINSPHLSSPRPVLSSSSSSNMHPPVPPPPFFFNSYSEVRAGRTAFISPSFLSFFSSSSSSSFLLSSICSSSPSFLL